MTDVNYAEKAVSQEVFIIVGEVHVRVCELPHFAHKSWNGFGWSDLLISVWPL